METKPLEWVLDAAYLRPAFRIAADFSRALYLAARRALNGSCDATPRRAPDDYATSRINLSVFTCWKHKMFRPPPWKSFRPKMKSRPSRLRKRNRPSFAGLRNARAKGKTLGRPRVTVDTAKIASLRATGASWQKITRQLGISAGTAKRAFYSLSKNRSLPVSVSC